MEYYAVVRRNEEDPYTDKKRSIGHIIKWWRQCVEQSILFDWYIPLV